MVDADYWKSIAFFKLSENKNFSGQLFYYSLKWNADSLHDIETNMNLPQGTNSDAFLLKNHCKPKRNPPGLGTLFWERKSSTSDTLISTTSMSSPSSGLPPPELT